MTSSKAKMGFESPPNSPGAQQMLAMEAGGASLVGLSCVLREDWGHGGAIVEPGEGVDDKGRRQSGPD